jgi:phosphoribosylaminoimidazole-succinocarboxamide synthase
MPDTFVAEISERYIELYETITDQKFQRAKTEDIAARIEKNVMAELKRLGM